MIFNTYQPNKPRKEYRTYKGLVYEATVIHGHTNVLAMEVAAAPEETATGKGISFPRGQWANLPLSDRDF